MKLVVLLGLIALIVVAAVSWQVHLKPSPLPAAENIDRIHIYFGENIGDLLPEDYVPKEFEITNKEEIAVVRKLIGDLPVPKLPLINSDDIDEGPGWMLNIHGKNGEHWFIPIDKNQILGKRQPSSRLYLYLSENYT